MKIIRLELQNFMPYRERSRIDFAADPKKNVTLVYGDNMRGKTSLLNALRWCLYGEAWGRDRRPIPNNLLLNSDALTDHDWRFEVSVDLEVDGNSIQVRRRAEAASGRQAPRKSTDFDILLDLAIDGQPVARDKVEELIGKLAPQQTSRFMLFDAELLAEYEELLSEDSSQGDRIKQAIEDQLGLPALQKARSAFRTLSKNAQDHLARATRASEVERAHSEEWQRANQEAEEVAEEVNLLKAKQNAAKRELRTTDAELSVIADVTDIIKDRERLLGTQESLRSQKATTVSEIQSQAAVLWRDVLAERLRPEIEKLTRVMHDYRSSSERRGALRQRLDDYRSLLAEGECALCEHAISERDRTAIGRKVGEIENEISELESRSSDEIAVSGRIAALSKVQSVGTLARLETLDAQLTTIAVSETSVEEDLSDCDERLRGVDVADVARLRTKRDQLIQHLGTIDLEIRQANERQKTKEDRRDQLGKLIRRASGASNRRLVIEGTLYDQLAEIFESSIAALRDQQRTEVQSLASEAFKKLTSESTYSGLKINDRYGLAILDQRNRAVPLRSAGAEQIVALSLIDGLSKATGRSAPVLIDTPLGRLDPTHRSKVLQFLPNMAEQITLFLHEGELSRTGDNPISGRVGARYVIERVSGTQSRIHKE